jgi:hypothetical protein
MQVIAHLQLSSTFSFDYQPDGAGSGPHNKLYFNLG